MGDGNLLDHWLFNLNSLHNWNVLNDFVGFWDFDSLCYGNFLDNFDFLDDLDGFFDGLDDFNYFDDFLNDRDVFNDLNLFDDFDW